MGKTRGCPERRLAIYLSSPQRALQKRQAASERLPRNAFARRYSLAYPRDRSVAPPRRSLLTPKVSGGHWVAVPPPTELPAGARRLHLQRSRLRVGGSSNRVDGGVAPSCANRFAQATRKRPKHSGRCSVGTLDLSLWASGFSSELSVAPAAIGTFGLPTVSTVLQERRFMLSRTSASR